MTDIDHHDPGSDDDRKSDPMDSGRAHEFNIRIDREHYKVSKAKLTGAQLRALPNPDVGPDRDLFQVVPGGSDRKVELNDVIEMKDGLRFFTAPAQINPGNC